MEVDFAARRGEAFHPHDQPDVAASFLTGVDVVRRASPPGLIHLKTVFRREATDDLGEGMTIDEVLFDAAQ